ncbi:hypothetical protein AX16_003790 [Volvariella volvacea WC 439]|nr:hypothetical protein AX16_003790 [Volvariella volvacea WC 439]
MWRVYALYDKNRFIVTLLAIVFAANIGASVVFWKTVLKHIDFDERCTPGGEPQFETVYMAVFIIISHFFFWGLEFFKLQTFVWRRVVLAVPRLASLLMKDGALIFIGFSGVSTISGGNFPSSPTFGSIGVLASSLAYTFRVRQMAHVILPIITSFLSIATCRMIMRYLTLGSQVGASHSSGSDYDLSCWDTDTIERVVSVQVIDIDGDMDIRTVHRINTNNHTTPSIQ